MSSLQDLPSETFNTTEMSSEADANESTAPQLTPGAIQIDPSTLTCTHLKSKPAKTKKTSQSQTRNSKANKNKKTKKPRTESEHDDDSSEDEEDESGVTKKKNPHWENDDNGKGKSLMYLLLDWLTKEGNYDRYKNNKCEKRGVAEEIQQYMIDNGIHSRDASTIGKKRRLAQDCKAIEGWANDNPKWLSLEKAALAPILKNFADDDTDEVEILTQTQCVAREHSLHSNSAYENINNDIKELNWVQIEHSPNSILEYHDCTGSSDETMDEIKGAIENANNEGDILDSNPITPSRQITPYRPSQSQYPAPNSNDNLKHTSSKSSLALSSHNEINIINSPISQIHTQKLDCLSQIADNVASHMFPQHEKNFLTEDDAKKKAKIELDMAAVQLKSEKKKLQQHNFDLLSRREKHNLEMQRYQAEITHEKMTRHAQLIIKTLTSLINPSPPSSNS
ncbi:hypothetical protein DFH28DRAFT_1119364 [Melampsora americana]|nr:hypothetical protein DFH28DRAFT_1119364 [Melampsora americana]